MPRKPKFKPIITKVKCDPEQVVLTCDCYDVNRGYGGGGCNPSAVRCYFGMGGVKEKNTGGYYFSPATISS